jgi:hypothetical protein
MTSSVESIKSGFATPIALLNFNRPHLARQVFDVVRQIKPQRLLLVADGPRADKPDDARLCAEVRAIFDEIDWECEVSRNFSETNMGSFKRNSTGLDWVFDSVEEAIILEDDCVPSLSFFPYCAELLEQYRNDTRVGVISGNCFVPPGPAQDDASYFFSAYALTWGWASWRRVWKQVDLTMSWWESVSGTEMLTTLHQTPQESEYWVKLYEGISSGSYKNAWDHQIILSGFRHSQLCIIPSVNLISNLGCGEDGTHLKDANSPLANIPTQELSFPMRTPSKIWRSGSMDHAIFKTRIDINIPPSLTHRILAIIARFLPALLKRRLKKLIRGG